VVLKTLNKESHEKCNLPDVFTNLESSCWHHILSIQWRHRLNMFFVSLHFRNLSSQSSPQFNPLRIRRSHPGFESAHGHGPKSHWFYRLSGKEEMLFIRHDLDHKFNLNWQFEIYRIGRKLGDVTNLDRLPWNCLW
jgi:hypothetical protein